MASETLVNKRGKQMKKKRKQSYLFITSLIFGLPVLHAKTALANEHSQKNSDANASLNTTLPNGKLIDELLTKYEVETDKNKKTFYLTASAEQHSGLANLLLAKKANTPVNKKIHYYLEAAKYGYRNEGYQGIATLYDQGVGVEKDELLANCYSNLTKETPNQAFIGVCQSRYPQGFVVVANHALQSSKEIIKKADKDYQAFCKNFRQANLLSASIDQQEQQILANRFCHQKIAPNKLIHHGDIVLKDNELFQYTTKGYVPYLDQISEGLPVYRFNPPVSLYIYHDGKLVLAHNGDKVIKDDQSYIVKNNQLVKFS